MKTPLKLFILSALLMLFVFHAGSDDKELFMGVQSGNLDKVKPNVIMVIDNSGSMNNIIFYPSDPAAIDPSLPTPGYNPKIDYNGEVDDYWGNKSSSRYECRWYRASRNRAYDYTRSIQRYGGATTNLTLNRWDSDFSDYLAVGDWIHCSNESGYGRVASKNASTGNVTLTDVHGTFTGTYIRLFQYDSNTAYQFRAVYCYGTNENYDPWVDAPGDRTVRWPYNYIQWLFCHATDAHRDAVSYYFQNGTFIVGAAPFTGLSACSSGSFSPADPPRRLNTRIQVAREVFCQVMSDAHTISNLGLYTFNYSMGGTQLEELQDASDISALEPIQQTVYKTDANGWTPLSETLADVWYDLKPGPDGDKTYWPVKWEVDQFNEPSSSGWPEHDFVDHNSPIEYYCQKNFVILMTDGESTQDNFDHSKYDNSVFTTMPVRRGTDWENWDDGWGDGDENDASSDFIPVGYDPDDVSGYCPNYTCWQTGSDGTDLLDDVTYFLANQDMFPDGDGYFSDDNNSLDGWPGNQTINTYIVGFAMDNDMLAEAASNGNGEYHKADDYSQLVNAFKSIFDSIKVRSYAFASITAPRRSTSTSSESISYIGFFIPSNSNPIWDGYLWAYKLFDSWGWDSDGSGVIDKSGDPTINEFTYDKKEDCLAASGGSPCERWMRLSATREYDSAAILRDQGPRNLWTYLFKNWWYDTDGEGDYDQDELFSTQLACETATGQSCTEVEAGKYFEFTLANEPELRTRLAAADASEGQAVINRIKENHLADIFHSDVMFVGGPPKGKNYQPKINPLDPDGEPYIDFYNDFKDRTRILTLGTNDGIFHVFDANEDLAAGGGRELYGYIPDTVLPILRNMVLGDGTLPAQHTFTVDGRVSAESIYFNQGSDTHPSWLTMLVFGLREGGRDYHALDINDTSPTAVQPTVMWKFTDDTYSGNSWGKPLFGKIHVNDGAGNIVDKHVVILTGGMAYNHENTADLKGKAVFVVDASNGELIWMVGFNPSGAADVSGTSELETATIGGDTKRYLTRDEVFNFSIPSAITTLDRDNDGLLDSIYFGNLGGNVFKVEMSAKDPADWKTYHLFRSAVVTDSGQNISNITDDKVNIGADDSNFDVGRTVMGLTSKAFAHIKDKEEISGDWVLTVGMLSGTLQTGETLVPKTYQPIFLSPAVARDDCSKLWVTFGTGDRDRPRSNPATGRFVAFLDSGDTDLSLTDLQQLTWTDDEIDELPTGTTIDKGWYFNFPDSAEKMFDPEPYILPDDYMTAHIHFNTFQPPTTTGGSTAINPCSITEGGMTRYDITIEECLPIVIDGDRDTGRIAGGGMYEGGEYVTYTSETGMVADVPVKDQDGEELLYKTNAQKFPYPGGLIFLREITR